jgi:nicotinate-nucleotide adenylyltransferase
LPGSDLRLGIFGGTFNPIHLGHLRTAEEVRYKLRLDKVIFVPSGNPPLKERDAVAASHRYAMATLAAASNKYFIVSDLEARKPGKSYTVDTFQTLDKKYHGDELFFILGADAFLDIPRWRQPEKLLGMTDFIIVARPGAGFDAIEDSPYIMAVKKKERAKIRLLGGRTAFLVQVTQLDISSTKIRRLIKQKKSVKYLFPSSVEAYIREHKLYRMRTEGA